ncbi:Cyclomaltodextrinase [subsurface metagenome]
MPDRFSNGDRSNDTVEGMLEQTNRQNPDGRHGGDIAGIAKHIDYIADMGFTALWANPLLENNMPEKSYHGYAITDYYTIDPRFGTNSDYRNLVGLAHEKGLKVIMDMVFNHCGTNHWLVRDLPMDDWVNQWDTFTRSNYRIEVKTDPYASDYDLKLMGKGWFDVTMADLNQKNPYVWKYLVQNSIWWIEFAGIDGIRMDAYPYTDREAMSEWAMTIRKLYPSFTILGEIWLQKSSHTAYWQDNERNMDDYRSNIPAVTDFRTHYAVIEALSEKEGWTQGLRRLYYVLSQDFLYNNPENLLVFPDNHDLNRYYTSLNEDFDKYKLGLAFLLTTRGIPQIYYGTEILMTGEEHKGHGYIRQDFPGGWEGDTIDAFNGTGLNEDQEEAQRFVQKLLTWRQKTPAIHNGKLIHFIPEDDVYVYFRTTNSQSVMVILNKNEEDILVDMRRYREGLNGFSSAIDVISSEKITNLDQIFVQGMSPLILELSGND